MERFAGSALKKMRDALKTYANSQKRPMEYSVEFDSPFFNGPTFITCLDVRPTTSGSKKGAAGGKKSGGDGETEGEAQHWRERTHMRLPAVRLLLVAYCC